MAKDITGKKFGRLTPIKKVGKKGSNNIWECLCDCGNIKQIMCTSLILGNTKSCGCLIKEARINKREEMAGKTFGNIIVLNNLPRKNGKSHVWGKCICGVEKIFKTDHLKSGATQSCGCIGAKNRALSKIKHNLSGNKLYFVWASMMVRCYKKTFPDYHNYGGRGIKVCEEWMTVENFISDMQEGYAKGLQLDRIDNNSDYSKMNCKWSTRKENNRNKRNNVMIEIDGIILTMVEWSEKENIKYSTIRNRKRRGLTGKDLISK